MCEKKKRMAGGGGGGGRISEGRRGVEERGE
jgi:hypothetical protein